MSNLHGDRIAYLPLSDTMSDEHTSDMQLLRTVFNNNMTTEIPTSQPKYFNTIPIVATVLFGLLSSPVGDSLINQLIATLQPSQAGKTWVSLLVKVLLFFAVMMYLTRQNE